MGTGEGDPLLRRDRLHAGRRSSRIIWMFTGNRYARWDKFLPVRPAPAPGVWPDAQVLPVRAAQAAGLRRPQSAGRRSPTRLVFVLYFIDDRHRARAAHGRAPTWARPSGCFAFLVPLFGGLADGALDPPRRACGSSSGFAVHHVYSAHPDVAGRRRTPRSSRSSRATSSCPARTSTTRVTASSPAKDESMAEPTRAARPRPRQPSAAATTASARPPSPRLDRDWEAPDGRARARRRHARPLAAAVPRGRRRRDPRRRHPRADAPAGALVRLDGRRRGARRAPPALAAPGRRGRSARRRALHDRYPRRLVLLGLVPRTLGLGIDRSPEVEARIPGLVEAVVEEAHRMGYVFARRTDNEKAARFRGDVARVFGL